MCENLQPIRLTLKNILMRAGFCLRESRAVHVCVSLIEVSAKEKKCSCLGHFRRRHARREFLSHSEENRAMCSCRFFIVGRG
jgi:hypothetical protein